MARTVGSKNKPKIGDVVSFKKLNDMANDVELDKLKNLIARQDDVIAQLQDDVNQLKKTRQVLEDECGQLEDKIESYREIIKTIMEITE